MRNSTALQTPRHGSPLVSLAVGGDFFFFFLAGSSSGCIAISRKVPGFEGVNCGDGVLTGIACAKECSLELDNICAND